MPAHVAHVVQAAAPVCDSACEQARAAWAQVEEARKANQLAWNAFVLGVIQAGATLLLALIPAILAARQIFADSPKVSSNYSIIYPEDEENRSYASITNVGTVDIVVEWYEFYLRKPRFLLTIWRSPDRDRFGDSPDGPMESMKIAPKETRRFSLEDVNTGRWKKLRKEGKKLYLLLYLAGRRRPLEKLIY